MKHNKLFAMLAVAAALAVTGCNPGGGSDSTSKHVHTAAADAPWQHDNNNHWKDCEANDGGKAENAKHTFGDPTDVVPATCQAAGSQKVKCTVCGAEVTQTLPIKDHTWGEWEVTQAATCTEAGSRKHVCSVCQTEESETIPATGHDWDEWESIKDPTCTEGGSRKHKCKVCQVEETEQLEALGHDIQLVDDQGEPEAGKAKVRLYDCSRCDVTYLGFKATEVTPASHDRLVFETVTTGEKEEQGARFFGHPIGNDCELDPTTGDPTEGVAEVYSKDQTGDYFEYKFDLTDEQVNVLSGDEGACLLYCDAQPAQWMQQNNMDFFAKGTETDWTKAYYIDDDPAHYNEDGSAKEIAGWRYVLYVDGQYQDFDANVASNPMKNNDRGEFVMPYLFKLHKGENTISLRMAAGYRCTFFNFTFRPYVKPTQIVASPDSIEITEGETAQITSTMEGLKYASASNAIATVNAEGLVTGVKAGETKITVSKDGNYRALEIPVKVNAPAGLIELNLTDGVIAPEGGLRVYESSSSGTWYREWKKDTTVTYTFQSELAGLFDIKLGLRGSNIPLADNFAIKVNNADVAIEGTVNTSYNAVDFVVGQAELIKGENTMVITCLVECDLYLKTLSLAPHQFKAIKTWSSEDIKAGLTEGKTLTEKDFGNSLPGVKGYKFNKADTTCTLTFTAEAAMEVELQLLLGVKKGNQANTGFWRQADSTADPKPEKDSITVNGTKVTPPEQDVDFTDCVTESDQSDNGTLMVPQWKKVCNISLQQGENTIVIAYIAGGYSLYLCGARIGK